jgi:hypothetical protein
MTGVALEAETDCGTAKMENSRMYELDTDNQTGSANLLSEDEIDMEEADQDFTLFLKLPLELRRMIWKEALTGLRVIEIHLTVVDGRDVSQVPKWHPACVDKAPALFFACREARAVVTENYNLFKGDSGLGAIWSDVRHDLFCFGFWRWHYNVAICFDNMPEEVRSRMSRIALDFELIDGMWSTLAAERLKEVFISYHHLEGSDRRVITGFDEFGTDDHNTELAQEIRAAMNNISEKIEKVQPRMDKPIGEDRNVNLR